jgi:hypothetical protein
MRKILLAATVLGTIAGAGAANAGPGQCYDGYGRPVGPVYDTDRPNYSFINSVIRRGGSCTGVVSEPGRRNYYGYKPDDRYKRGDYYKRDGYKRDGYHRDPSRDPRFSKEQQRSLKPDINGNLPTIEQPSR